MATTLLFTQPKGGAGKSTILTQLAAHWLGQGRRTALLDLDPQRSTARWGRERASAGRAAPALLLESADWRAASDLRDAARVAEMILIDTAGRADAAGLSLADAADLVLIPCQPSAPDLWATEDLLKDLIRRRRPHLVILNRIAPRGRAADQAAASLEGLGARLAPTRIGTRAGFAEAFRTGAGAAEAEPGSKAAAEIAALARDIEGMLRP